MANYQSIEFPSSAMSASSHDGKTIVSVPLFIQNDHLTPVSQPVTCGISFPRSFLMDGVALSLLDPSGHQVCVQAVPLAYWSDGSVKWMLLDFVLGPLDQGRSVWSLRLSPNRRSGLMQMEPRIVVEETEQEFAITTGCTSFILDRRFLAPIAQVEINGKHILDSTHARTVVIDQGGRCRRRIERSEIETHGPVRASVRFEGRFEGRRGYRLYFLSRVSFFAGLSLVRVDLTLHNPRRARHRGGLWDLGDPGSILFRDLSLQLRMTESRPHRVEWVEDVDGPGRGAETDVFEIYQDSSGGERWKSRNHVNRSGQVPCRFRGFRVQHGGAPSFGLRASPVVSVQGGTATITVAIPEFWQQFPKAIDTMEETLNIRLFPGQFGDLFELQGGEQKTHSVWLKFDRAKHSGVDSLGWVHRPARRRGGAGMER